MNWNIIVEAILENVKDAEVRQAIYTDIVQSCSFDELDTIDETVFGDDPVFDGVWSEHGEPMIHEEEYYDEDEDEDEEGDDDSDDWDSQDESSF